MSATRVLIALALFTASIEAAAAQQPTELYPVPKERYPISILEPYPNPQQWPVQSLSPEEARKKRFHPLLVLGALGLGAAAVGAAAVGTAAVGAAAAGTAAVGTAALFGAGVAAHHALYYPPPYWYRGYERSYNGYRYRYYTRW